MAFPAELEEIAAICSRAIYAWGGANGFDSFDLKRRVHQLDALCYTDQFRVFTILARSKYIATKGDGVNGWHFWARHFAPAGAYVAPDRSVDVS